MQIFVLTERLIDKNGWQHYDLWSGRTTDEDIMATVAIPTAPEHKRDRYFYDFATTTQVQGAVNPFPV